MATRPHSGRRYLEHRLKFHHLRMMEAISAQLTLGQAAKALGVTQPALSRSLHQLEDTLGVRLFDRSAKGLSPTPFGQATCATSQRILAEVKQLDGALDRLLSEAAGAFVIGAMPVAAVDVLPSVLTRLIHARPELAIRVVEGGQDELFAQLAAGAVDVIVGRLDAPPAPDRLVREALYVETLALLGRAGHPLFAAANVSGGAAYALILPDIDQGLSQEIEPIVAAFGVSATVALRSNSAAFIREMLHQSDLLTLLPRSLMAGDLRRGSLREAPAPFDIPPRPAGLVYRDEATLRPGLRELLDTLRVYILAACQQDIRAA